MLFQRELLNILFLKIKIMNILNITAYKFVNLAQPALIDLQSLLKTRCAVLKLKGTILLSAEGINQCVAGTAEAIASFKNFLSKISVFADLTYKESWSEQQPFKRMLVKIKKEIITFKKANIAPAEFTAPHITPQTLKEWYAQKRDMVVLDTRNHYEIRLGKFVQAVDLNLQHFHEFPQAVQETLGNLKDKTIVTYCTGGIRCEKAAAWMLAAGFKEVYQLEGGILNYFAECGGEHYEGECFVFDNRIAVDADLVAQK